MIWPEVTSEDLRLVFERAGRPLHESEVARLWQELWVERWLEEAVAAGEIEAVVVGGERCYRAILCSYDGCERLPRKNRKWCREHAGGLTVAERVGHAVRRRRAGRRFSEIARELEVDAQTVSGYMMTAGEWGLCHASPRQLAEWRATDSLAKGCQ